MHHDQRAIYDMFLEFQQNKDGIEVTEADLISAWKAAKQVTGYFIEEDKSNG